MALKTEFDRQLILKNDPELHVCKVLILEDIIYIDHPNFLQTDGLLLLRFVSKYKLRKWEDWSLYKRVCTMGTACEFSGYFHRKNKVYRKAFAK